MPALNACALDRLKDLRNALILVYRRVLRKLDKRPVPV